MLEGPRPLGALLREALALGEMADSTAIIAWMASLSPIERASVQSFASHHPSFSELIIIWEQQFTELLSIVRDWTPEQVEHIFEFDRTPDPPAPGASPFTRIFRFPPPADDPRAN